MTPNAAYPGWPEVITDAFAITRSGASLILRCKTCGSGWEYPVSKEPTAAAILRLLDHAHYHDGEDN